MNCYVLPSLTGLACVLHGMKYRGSCRCASPWRWEAPRKPAQDCCYEAKSRKGRQDYSPASDCRVGSGTWQVPIGTAEPDQSTTFYSFIKEQKVPVCRRQALPLFFPLFLAGRPAAPPGAGLRAGPDPDTCPASRGTPGRLPGGEKIRARPRKSGASCPSPVCPAAERRDAAATRTGSWNRIVR